MWVVVIAGNEPRKEVSALTSGNFARVDIDRLMGATEANIVEEIKQYPNSIGQLSTYWDCKIIHMPIVAIQAVIRDYANEKLKQKMKEVGLSTKGDKSGKDKLQKTDLFKILDNKPMGVGTRGSKSGNNSISTFEKIALIASTNDILLNEALAVGLQDLGIITEYKLEQDFGTGLTRRTDIICYLNDNSTIRLEIMWRRKTGQADIANYVLQKIFNYGKAIGII